jgi:hypothetical protein
VIGYFTPARANALRTTADVIRHLVQTQPVASKNAFAIAPKSAVIGSSCPAGELVEPLDHDRKPPGT